MIEKLDDGKNVFNEQSENFVFNENYNKNKVNDIILNISYIGEKVFHGKPSGLDNTISLYGGIIKFIDFKEKNFARLDKNKIDKFKENFSLYLIDTNVKRNTIKFMLKVKEFKNNHPELFNYFI